MNYFRACPECRVTSDFVCPSSVWVDATCGKDKLLTDYKQALSQKPCKHFKQGRAKCPFGNKCFYLHALPDGTKADVGPPVRRSRNREMDIDMVQVRRRLALLLLQWHNASLGIHIIHSQ